MQQKSKLQISVLPNTRDPEFEQRESDIVHTSYEEEQAFYALIERGDTGAIRIETLAEIAHFSPDYFYKYFKRHVGTTPVQYIMNQKLRCACGMIENGFDLHTIAYYLGFCSQTYFITCFKKAYSLTPHQYAVQHRK